MFHIWGVSVCPIHLDAPICLSTPICPQCSHVHLYVLGVSACDREMQGAILMFGHLPMCPTPPHIYMLPCMSMF